MAKQQATIDTNKVTLDGLNVLYQGKAIGRIRDTGKRYCDGLETIWGTEVNDEIFYSAKAAAISVVMQKGNVNANK